MGRIKDLYIDKHEELFVAYMEEHPRATEEEAYDATLSSVHAAVRDHPDDIKDRLMEQN